MYKSQDSDGDGLYNPTRGDYPDVPGDQAIFWVYNDKGNAHSETGGDAIGLEIQALAYAFVSDDALNNTTFYRYKTLYYGTTALDSVYLSKWVDADIGYFLDDYVGCDTTRNLGICYTGNTFDSLYGYNPPMLAVDLLKGPTHYFPFDSGQLGMTGFATYYNLSLIHI